MAPVEEQNDQEAHDGHHVDHAGVNVDDAIATLPELVFKVQRHQDQNDVDDGQVLRVEYALADLIAHLEVVVFD